MQKGKDVTLPDLTSDQIAEQRGVARMEVRRLEGLKHLRTADEEFELSKRRAELRQLTRAMEERFEQVRLF